LLRLGWGRSECRPLTSMGWQLVLRPRSRQGNKMLGELVAETGVKRAEYGRRSKVYDEESFEKPLRETREADGWVFLRENKTTNRMRRAKRFDEVIENRFWGILYRFGYSELNAGRQFRIVVGKGEQATEKQIDVFAKDDETVVVAECKACESPTKRSLLKDLNEFAGLMKPIADAVRKHYGDGYKPKFIWCFVTNNLRWSNEDIKRAKEHNIKVIRELELLYFEEFSRKIGPAARFQFHAEYLEDQQVPALSGRKVPAVKTKLGGTTAYLFSALAKDILRIAFVNHRDLRDPSGAPSYQRIVKPGRLKQIGAFLDEKGFFPNTILLNFHRQPRFEQVARDETSGIAFGNLILPDKYKSCWIIDGQHRLYGTIFTNKEYTAPLFFVAFDKVTKAQEAHIFVEINAKQATVPPTLLSALDAEVKWDSEVPKERLAAIASRAVDLMNTKGSGPLEAKVVSPGITAGTSQPLHLRSIQERIVFSGLLGSINSKTGEIIPGPCWAGASEDSLIRLVELLDMHLEHVRNANPLRWDAGRLGALCTNLGVGSQIRLLSELIRFVGYKESLHPQAVELNELYDAVYPYMGRMFEYIRATSDEEFKAKFTVIFGSSGYHEYFFKLFSLIEQDVPDLKPEGYEEYKRTTSAETTEQADRQVKWIQAVVPAFLKDKLREKFGEGFFEIVVPKEVQKACQIKRVDDESEDKLPVEEYLEWIHYATLAPMKEIRDEVKAVLSIRLPGEPAGKHFYRAWFDAINKIRRVPAHPSGRAYKSENIETLSIIVDHLKSNLPHSFAEGHFDATLS
jgi:DNA sulfur modification protein DndB